MSFLVPSKSVLQSEVGSHESVRVRDVEVNGLRTGGKAGKKKEWDARARGWMNVIPIQNGRRAGMLTTYLKIAGYAEGDHAASKSAKHPGIFLL